MYLDYRFPGFRFKTLTFSYDDGIAGDIRLVDIFRKHGLKATFNINGGQLGRPGEGDHRRLTADEVRGLYRPAGMELAMHGYTHPFLERISPAAAMNEIIRDRMALEDLTGEILGGFAYPYGTYNDTVVSLLREAGIVYARTVAQTEGFAMPADWLRLASTCYHGNPRLMELGEKFLSLQENTVWRAKTTLQMCYVWGHSYEFGDWGKWQMIEDFAAMMAGHDDIWYATNMEIYRYMEAVSLLRSDVAGRVFHNPTHIDVYVYAEGKPVVLHGGETVRL